MREVGWAELLAHPDVDERSHLDGAVGMLAYHAGLEWATGPIAVDAAAAAGASLYVVDQPPRLRWHVASRAVDPAGSGCLRRLLDHIEVAISVHGYGFGRTGPDDPIFVGGSNRLLAAAVADELRTRLSAPGVVDDLAAIPSRYRGVHPANPVNLPRCGGVQVELPSSARDQRSHDVAAALAGAALRWQRDHPAP